MLRWPVCQELLFQCHQAAVTQPKRQHLSQLSCAARTAGETGRWVHSTVHPNKQVMDHMQQACFFCGSWHTQLQWLTSSTSSTVDGTLLLLKCIHILALPHGIRHTDTHVAFPAVHIFQKFFGGYKMPEKSVKAHRNFHQWAAFADHPLCLQMKFLPHLCGLLGTLLACVLTLWFMILLF